MFGRFRQHITVRNGLAWGICVAIGAAGTALGIPVAWLVCSMLTAVVLRLVNMPPGPHPDWVFNIVQALIGAVIGSSFSLDAIRPLAHDAVPVSLSILLVLVASVVAGRALTRFAAIAPSTAQIGSIPGGAASMLALSDDLGADTRLVAFMQYYRVIVVIISISFIASWAHGEHDIAVVADANGDAGLPEFGVGFAVVALGLLLATRIRIPAKTMLIPLVLAAVVSSVDWIDVRFPFWVLPVAYVLLGTRIGARFDRETVRQIRRVFPHLTVFVLVLIVVCSGLGLALAWATDIDVLTALLATSPGGMEAATIAAIETGANTPLVVAIQVTRMLAMVILGPLLVKRAVRTYSNLSTS